MMYGIYRICSTLWSDTGVTCFARIRIALLFIVCRVFDARVAN